MQCFLHRHRRWKSLKSVFSLPSTRAWYLGQATHLPLISKLIAGVNMDYVLHLCLLRAYRSSMFVHVYVALPIPLQLHTHTSGIQRNWSNFGNFCQILTSARLLLLFSLRSLVQRYSLCLARHSPRFCCLLTAKDAISHVIPEMKETWNVVHLISSGVLTHMCIFRYVYI